MEQRRAWVLSLLSSSLRALSSVDDDEDIRIDMVVPVFIKADISTGGGGVLVHGYPVIGLPATPEGSDALEELKRHLPVQLTVNSEGQTLRAAVGIQWADAYLTSQRLEHALVVLADIVNLAGHSLQTRFGGQTWRARANHAGPEPILVAAAMNGGAVSLLADNGDGSQRVIWEQAPSGRSLVLREDVGTDGTWRLEAIETLDGGCLLVCVDAGARVSRMFGPSVSRYEWRRLVEKEDLVRLAGHADDVLSLVSDLGAQVEVMTRNGDLPSDLQAWAT
jgi:hypothetical protein